LPPGKRWRTPSGGDRKKQSICRNPNKFSTALGERPSGVDIGAGGEDHAHAAMARDGLSEFLPRLAGAEEGMRAMKLIAFCTKRGAASQAAEALQSDFQRAGRSRTGIGRSSAVQPHEAMTSFDSTAFRPSASDQVMW